MKLEEEGKYVGSVIQKIRSDPHSFILLQYAKYLIYLFGRKVCDRDVEGGMNIKPLRPEHTNYLDCLLYV